MTMKTNNNDYWFLTPEMMEKYSHLLNKPYTEVFKSQELSQMELGPRIGLAIVISVGGEISDKEIADRFISEFRKVISVN